ncbi:MAG: transcription antitermination factor NusB [Firmicutes bacterium]|nr:transcription antitermination factor NusB [Bacillota bacterium]
MSIGRKQAREEAFKIIYGLGFLSDGITGDMQDKYMVILVNAVKDNLDQIDEKIKSVAKDFSFDRLFKVDLAVLRLAIAEMLYVDETPNAIAINAAVEISKKYSTEKSASFVNGVLAAINNAENKG